MSSSPRLAAAPANGPVLVAPWPDTLEARREADVQLARLHADVTAHDSATAALQAWCDRMGGGVVAPIRAVRTPGAEAASDVEARERLGVGPDAPLRYRHVRLMWGDRVLSEADNWYRPDLLTAAMNRTLEETETPFGVAVRSLGYHRATLSAERLWRPLEAAGPMPAAVLCAKAVLSLADGTPFSLVVETYRDQALFAPAH